MDHTRETYERSATGMAEKFRTMGPRTEDIDRIFAMLDKEDPFIFEIGCGDGRDAREICKRTSRYLGIDYSSAMVELARQYVPEGEFVCADVTEFEFPSQPDVIIAFASLLHLPHGEFVATVRRCFEALAPGGVFCISLKAGIGSKTTSDEFGERTFYFHTPEEILELLPASVESETSRSVIRGQEFFETFIRK